MRFTSVFPPVMKSFLGEFAACELRSTLFIWGFNKLGKKYMLITIIFSFAPYQNPR